MTKCSHKIYYAVDKGLTALVHSSLQKDLNGALNNGFCSQNILQRTVSLNTVLSKSIVTVARYLSWRSKLRLFQDKQV